MAKEVELEVFRVGGAASRHVKPEHLAEVASFDCDAHPVPVCFGHPKSDTPAAGTISRLRAEGNRLFATVKSFTDDAVEGIKKGEWINRSFAFFDPSHEANPRPGKWSPRHLGLLGGAAPGIPGMEPLKKALAFNAEDDTVVVDGDPADAVIYAAPPATPVHVVFEAKEPDMSGTPTPTPSPTPAATPTADELAFKARVDEFNKRVRNQFEASNKSAVDALVTAGKVLPAEADDLRVVFNALEMEEVEFGAGDKVTKGSASTKLAAFLDKALGKRVPIGERESPSTSFNAGPIGGATDWQAQAQQIAGEAQKRVKDRPGLTFEAAVEEIERERSAAAA
jgi:hypothetical protein